MALRNARDLYTRRNEGVSIWIVPRRHRLRPGRQGPVLRVPPGQGLPPRDVLHQERRREAPVSSTRNTETRPRALPRLSFGDTRAPRPAPPASPPATPCARRTSPCQSAAHRQAERGRRRVRAAPGRRRPDPCPAAGPLDLPRPGARGRHRPGQHRPGPVGPRPLLPYLRRPRLGQDRGRPCLLPREDEFRSRCTSFEQPNGHFAIDHRAPADRHDLPALLYRGCWIPRTKPSRQSARRPSRKWTTTATTPPSGCCAWAWAPRNRREKMRHALEVIWPYVDELFKDEQLTARLSAAMPPSPSRLRAACDRNHREVLAEADWTSPRPARPRRRPPGTATANTWASSLPKCRCWRASTPAPAGNHQEMYVSHPTAADGRPAEQKTPEQKAWDLAATVCDPEIPVLTIEDLGILRNVQRATTAGWSPPSTSPSRPPTRAARPWTPSATTSAAFRAEGYDKVNVSMVLSPAWTTDWMSESGKAKLRGIRHRPAHRPLAAGGTPGRSAWAWPSNARSAIAEHQGTLPLRFHLLQGAVRLPGLHGTVRLLQSFVRNRCSHDCCPPDRR